MISEIQYRVSSEWKTSYGILAFFSMISSLVIPVVYYISKKAQLHPSKQVMNNVFIRRILVYICIFEMVSCYHLMIWAMDLSNFLYFFRIYELINILLFGHGGTEQEDNVVECYQNRAIYFLSLYFEFSYYIVLNIDLIITIKRPFISGKSRMKKYHLVVFVFSLILFLFTIPQFKTMCLEEQNKEIVSIDSPYLFIAIDPVLVAQCIFYLFGILSIVMGIRSLSKATRSQADEVKKQYIYNHIIVVIMFALLWALPVVNNMLLNFKIYYETFNNVCFCILLSQGMILASVRMKDQFYRNRLKYFVMSFCSDEAKKKSQLMDMEEDGDQQTEPQDGWNTSLGAVLNKMQNESIVKCMLQGVITIILMDCESEVQTLPNHEVLKKWLKVKSTKQLLASNERDSVLSSREESLLPKSNRWIRMTEYAPQVFSLLRGYDRFGTEEVARSLDVVVNERQIKSAQQSMGKSGSFFFFSSDSRFILKTLRDGELAALLESVLYNYALYVSLNQHTLLAKLYGIFTVEIEGISPINLILMENSLGRLESAGQLHRIYDLKGSLVHRYVKTPTLDVSQFIPIRVAQQERLLRHPQVPSTAQGPQLPRAGERLHPAGPRQEAGTRQATQDRLHLPQRQQPHGLLPPPRSGHPLASRPTPYHLPLPPRPGRQPHQLLHHRLPPAVQLLEVPRKPLQVHHQEPENQKTHQLCHAQRVLRTILHLHQFLGCRCHQPLNNIFNYYLLLQEYLIEQGYLVVQLKGENRSRIDIIQIMRYIIKGGVWKNSEDEILKAAVMKYGLNQWSRISSLLVRKSAKQCKQRWQEYEWLDPSIKKTDWTREEEEKLLHLAKIFPSQWRTIAPIVGRTPMQCVEKYERLLDEAQGKKTNDPNDPRLLRPGEIDPNPETKPARPDPIDMDEDEKEMLAEARVRLANTKGKKAKRKARGKMIEEARRLAFLQKKRELKAAGIPFVNHRIEKVQKGIDYNAEIAFERMVPDFSFKPGTNENPDPDKSISNVSLQVLEGKRRDEEEEAKRKIDQRRIKKLKDRELDKAVIIQNKTATFFNAKTKLQLSDPQLKDQDLELLGKLNTVNEVSDYSNQATRALIGNYSQRERASSVVRTPRAPNSVMREARNILALQQTESPLVGGENATLEQHIASTKMSYNAETPNSLSKLLKTPNSQILGKQTPARSEKLLSRSETPAHDAFKLNIDEFGWDEQSQQSEKINMEQLRNQAQKQQIKEGLKTLPKPKNEFSVMIPDTDDINSQKQEIEMDAEDKEKLNKRLKHIQTVTELRKKSQPFQKNLQPPRILPNEPIYENTNNQIRDQLEKILNDNIIQLILEDFEGGKDVGSTKEAEQLLQNEIQALKDLFPYDDPDQKWNEFRNNIQYDPYNNEFVNINILEQERKLQILKAQYSRKYNILVTDSLFYFWQNRLEKKSGSLEGKLKTLLKGYQIRMTNITKEIEKLYLDFERCQSQIKIYSEALNQERRCYRDRIDELAKFHDMLQVKQNNLQQKHQDLQMEMEELHQEIDLLV